MMFMRSIRTASKSASIRKDLRRLYSSPKDPYAVLGIGRDASTSDIKRAYLELVKKYHPDTNKDPVAKTKFIEVQNAYEILSDDQKKKTFDQFGTTGEHAANGGGEGFGPGGFNIDPSEIFRNVFGGRGGFGGDFNFDIFGNNANSRSSNPFGSAETPLNIAVSVELGFLDAANGCSKDLSYKRYETCQSCTGTGNAKGTKPQKCTKCKGSGVEYSSRGSIYYSTTCRTCGGAGSLNVNPCQSCEGVGSVKRVATQRVDIPSGVSEGEYLTVHGGGNRIGGRIGDLMIQFAIEKSNQFIRKRNDIYSTITVDIYDALMGGEVIVPTIKGDVQMKITPGTQPDDVRKLSGRGIYNASTRQQGNHYVTLKVQLPRFLTSEQQKLLEIAFNPSLSSKKASPEGRKNFSAPDSKHESTEDGTQETTTEQKQTDSWLEIFRKWLSRN